MRQTLAQRDRLALTAVARPLQPVPLSAGQPLEVYRERSPWSMWGPVLTLVCILCAALLAIVYMIVTGSISLAEIDLATEQARLEHSRLMGQQDGWSNGKVTALVAAIIIGVMAVPGIVVMGRR